MITDRNTTRTWKPNAGFRLLLPALGLVGLAQLGLPVEARGSGADYDTLRNAALGTALPLPEGGLEWQVGDARVFLDSGTLQWMEPLADGTHTGAEFEGQGRFQLPVEHMAELRQLRRFAEDPDLESMSFSFEEMTIRGIDLASLLGIDAPNGGSYSRSGPFADAMESWIRSLWLDADARILAARVQPGDRFVSAEFDTEDYGTVYFTYDEAEQEEMSVVRMKDNYAESWVSLDRPDERRENGAPSSAWTDQWIALEEIDVAVDVTEPGKGSARGVGQVNPVKAVYRTTATYRAKVDGLGGLRLRLNPWAEVTAVRAGERDLEYLRFHRGGLSRGIPNELYDRSLVIFLGEKLAVDDRVTLTFDYHMEMGNFASLSSWYPTPVGSGFTEEHDVRMTFTHRRDYEVRAMGRQVEQRREGKDMVSVWETPAPVNAAAFTIARLPHEKSYEFDGLPTIHMFGTQAGSMSKEKIEGFSPDIINAVNYFQNLFGSKVGTDDLQVTYIASGHGQAGKGFIHISDSIAQFRGAANSGTREAFLAHEVAHEWWGHQLAWASYRDQWLSEGLAEYASMMFIEASLEKGDRILRDWVQAYHDEVNGSLKSAFGAFARPGLAFLNDKGRERVGPIGHGFRAGTAENPAAYTSMAYTKGALVMHSLRNIMRTITGNDELFIKVLRDFVATHRGGAVRTEDLLATIQKHAKSSYWPAFFDQYVYSNVMPTLEWSHETRQVEGEWVLSVEVTQTNVPEDFRTAVPLRAEFGKDRHGDMLLMVDQPTKRFDLKIGEKPSRVILNPDNAVLVQVK